MKKLRAKIRLSKKDEVAVPNHPNFTKVIQYLKFFDSRKNHSLSVYARSTIHDIFMRSFEKSTVGNGLFALNGDIIDFNEANQKIFGSKNRKEWEGYNLIRDERLPKIAQKALKRKLDVRFSLPFIVNHRERILDVIAFWLRDDQARPYALMVQTQDVTKQKKAEAQLKLTQKMLQAEIANRTAELTETNKMLREELAWHKTTEKHLLQQTQDLQDGEKKYRALFLQSPVALHVNIGTKLINGNRACLELFGAESPKQMMGRDLLDFVPENYKEFVKKRLEFVANKGNVPPAEIKIIRFDGSVIDVEARRIAISYKGKPAVLSMLRDITEKKRTDRILQAKAKLFTLHNENSKLQDYLNAIAIQLAEWSDCRQAGIRLFNKNEQLTAHTGFSQTYWNRILKNKKKGCACSLIRENKLQEVCPDMCEEDVFVKNEKCAKSFGPCSKGYASLAILPIKHKGEIVGMIHLADGKPEKFSKETLTFLKKISNTIGNSLTEVLQETELKRTNELLESVFDQSSISFAYLDKNLRYKKVNQRFCEMAGLPEEKILGRSREEMFDGVDENTIMLRRVLDTGVPHSAFSFPLRVKSRPDISTSYWDWNAKRITDSNGEVSGVLISAVDVTERHNVEERLLESYKHLGIINRKVAILLDLNKLHGGKDSSHIMQFIVNSAHKLSQARSVSFYEYSRANEVLKLRSLAGKSTSRNPEIILPKRCASLQQMVKKKTRVQGAFQSENGDWSCHHPEKSDSYHLFMPIVIRNQFRGCIHFEFGKRSFVTTQELDLYEAFAANTAIALEKLKLFRNHELERETLPVPEHLKYTQSE